MRIVKETILNDIKVTIMVMNGKYCLKLEKNLLEQTYKFRDGSGMDSADKIESMLNEAFYQEANILFNSMSLLRKEALINMLNDDDDFEVIV